jgi:competence protein ComEC
MTYNKLKKIQVYILISLIYIIFNENFRLIFNTRNILELDQINWPSVLSLTKINKSEENTNLGTVSLITDPSEGWFECQNSHYIASEQRKSVSKHAVTTDRMICELKRLINSLVRLSSNLLVSVKHRYLSGQESLNHWRTTSLKSLEEVVGARGAPLVKGVLFGDVSGIDQETYHSFRVIGILHILSASSANFTVILAFFLFLLKPLLKHLARWQVFLLHFLIIFGYFSLVGAAASTARAFLSLSLAYVATFLMQRAFLPLYTLCLVGIFMLFINPIWLDSLGYQFSFLASFGILFLYSFLEKVPFIHKNYLFKSIMLTFSAQFFLFPILVFNFGELNYLAILGNLLVLPLVEILTILFLVSFICLFFIELPHMIYLKYFLSYLISKTIDILFILIKYLEKIPIKSFIFKENKELYTIIFIIINLACILCISRLKAKRYSKNTYRVFK